MADSFLRLPLFQAFDYYEPSEIPDDNLDDRPATVSTRFRCDVEQTARRYLAGVSLNIYSGTTFARLDYPTRDYERKHPPLPDPTPRTRPYYAIKRESHVQHPQSDAESTVPGSRGATSVEGGSEVEHDGSQSEEVARQERPPRKRSKRYTIEQRTEQQSNNRAELLHTCDEPRTAGPQAVDDSCQHPQEQLSDRGDTDEALQCTHILVRSEHYPPTYGATLSNDQIYDQSPKKPGVDQPNTDRDLKFRAQRPNAVDHLDRAWLESQPGKSTQDAWRAAEKTRPTQTEHNTPHKQSNRALPVNNTHSRDARSTDDVSQGEGVTADFAEAEGVQEGEQSETSSTPADTLKQRPQPEPRERRGRTTKSFSTGATSDLVVPNDLNTAGKTSRAARHKRFDPARALQHASLGVQESPQDHEKNLLTCFECQRTDCKRLVKSHHGPKTICDKCAYQFRQKKQVDELVNARLHAAPSAVQAQKSRRPRKSGRTPKSSQNSCSTSQSRATADREARIRAALQAHQPTPGASVMQDMFGGSPMDMMHRRESQLTNLLQADASQRIEEILLLRTRSGARSPELRGASTLGTKHQRGVGRGSRTHPQGSDIPPADRKKKRNMTFDTPILGRASKGPRLTPSNDHDSPGVESQPQSEKAVTSRNVLQERIASGDPQSLAKDRTPSAKTNPAPVAVLKVPPGSTRNMPQRSSKGKATPGSQLVSVVIPKSSHRASQCRTYAPPRQALVEQATNRVVSPTASRAKISRAGRKSNVRWAGSPSPASEDEVGLREEGGEEVDDDELGSVHENNCASQYPSTQTMLNQAYEDFEGALDSPEKPPTQSSPQKRSIAERSGAKGTPYRASRPTGTPARSNTSIHETPNNAAPINTQALFDAYTFTPTSNASPTTNLSPSNPVSNGIETNTVPRARPSWLKDNSSINFGSPLLVQTPTGSTAGTTASKGLLKSVLKRKSNNRAKLSTEYMTRDSTGSYVSENATKSSRTSLSSVTNAHMDEISPAKSAASGWLSPGRDDEGGMDLDSFLDQTAGMLGSWDASQEAQRV